LVWFGEIERKLAKLSMTTLLTVLLLNYFMAATLVRVASGWLPNFKKVPPRLGAIRMAILVFE
jgi:hypothetical protein